LGGVADELKAQLVTDFRAAGIAEDDKLMLEYVEVLTMSPQAVTASTVTPLKDRGFTDRMLHDIVQVTAYFAYVNRIADGLGVELEK
jgi:alkylhydroperoxidase family enzyme